MRRSGRRLCGRQRKNMAEEGEELKGYYERKIWNLEEALEKALQETERERSAREEATRYIYALLKQMGGHTIVRVEELQQQDGQLMCRVNRAAGVVRMNIEKKESRKCLKNTGNLTVMRRSTVRRPRS